MKLFLRTEGIRKVPFLLGVLKSVGQNQSWILDSPSVGKVPGFWTVCKILLQVVGQDGYFINIQSPGGMDGLCYFSAAFPPLVLAGGFGVDLPLSNVLRFST